MTTNSRTSMLGATSLAWLLVGCIQQPASQSPDEAPTGQPAPVAVVQAPTTAAEPAPAAAAPAAEESAEASPEPATSNAPSPDQEGNILIDPMSEGVWGYPSDLGALSKVQEGGKDVLRYVTENPGPQKWSLQMCMGGVVIVNGRQYKLSLDARSGDPQMETYPVLVVTQSAGGKYHGTGLWRKVNLTKQWKTHELTFIGSKADENLSRLCINPDNVPGIIDIRSVSIEPVK